MKHDFPAEEWASRNMGARPWSASPTDMANRSATESKLRNAVAQPALGKRAADDAITGEHGERAVQGGPQVSRRKTGVADGPIESRPLEYRCYAFRTRRRTMNIPAARRSSVPGSGVATLDVGSDPPSLSMSLKDHPSRSDRRSQCPSRIPLMRQLS